MAEGMLKFTSRTRQTPDKRAAAERVADFDEIYRAFASDRAAEQASRCSQCGVPFCQDHCPLGNNIPDWLRLVAEGRMEEAYAVASSTNSMPEVCGRICPQDRLCEGSCVIEQSGHGTVTIGAVESYIVETAFANGWVKPKRPQQLKAKSVAIIGAGPAGLAAAEILRSEGFEVTVFDRYDRAGGLRNLISQSPNAHQTLIISDLPGPASVAVGAALADTAEIVPVFDNWPHPLGVVRSHETLGAMLYYAHEIEEKRGKVGDKAPTVLLLDGNRLASYSDQDTQFDNRYLAKLPTAAELRSREIANVIYLVKDQTQKEELDDINEDFVEWQKQGINIRILPMTQFQGWEEPARTTGTGSTTSSVVHRHYYYGGSPLSHYWFYSHYGYSSPGQVVVMRDGLQTRIPRPTTAPSFDPPPYRPTSRPTVFSSSRIGGAATGVGKARPSGFGRTSVRMSSSGSITGVRSGRSGSYGRSGGGWFGG